MNRIWFFVMAALFLLSSLPADAQEQPVLQLALPEFEAAMFNEQVLERFRQETGITVQIVSVPMDSYFISGGTQEETLQALQDLATLADVLLLEPQHLLPAATLAGIYLDLSPLVGSDPTLDADDFYPAAWGAYQWNGGVWALPTSLDPIGLIYDPARFDEAGLPYPSADWTLDDLANAARALAVYDADGAVTVPGLMVWNENYLYGLFRSVVGTGFYDASTTPESPRVVTPEIEAALTLWNELVQEGVVGGVSMDSEQSPAMGITGSFGLFGLGSTVAIGGPGEPETSLVGTLLPGGQAMIDTRAVAVSAGTQYPEAAYQLAAFLTRQPEITNSGFSSSPARRSMVGATPAPNEDGGLMIMRPMSPEMQEFVDLGVENGMPIGELRYGWALLDALQLMDSEGLDATTALQQAEAALVTALAEADARETRFSVNAPEAEVILSEGEISLSFGVTSFVMPMPNQEAWEQLARDFAAADPQVGEVVLDTGFASNQERTETNDCFYLPENALDDLSLDSLLPFDPLTATDPTFDGSDFVGDSLAQGQRNGMTYALPVFITPRLMRYHTEVFAEAGLPAPEGGWTVEQFVDALRTLQPLLADPEATPLVARDPAGTYLLMLIAAYGGVPIDFSTDPVTFNFTDPATVEAIRQVLDLAREGLIDYQELSAGGAMFMISEATEDRTPIYAESFFGGFQVDVSIGENPYRQTTFPTGSQYTAVSYDLGMVYISASTPNAEACYRWISELMRHPELFGSMPSRDSYLEDPAYAASQSPETLAAYTRFADLMEQPNTISVASLFRGDFALMIPQRWLNQAFDEYVMRDGDLDAALAEAQAKTDQYLACVATIPPFDPTIQTQQDYTGLFRDCAVSIDPEAEALFPPQ